MFLHLSYSYDIHHSCHWTHNTCILMLNVECGDDELAWAHLMLMHMYLFKCAILYLIMFLGRTTAHMSVRDMIRYFHPFCCCFKTKKYISTSKVWFSGAYVPFPLDLTDMCNVQPEFKLICKRQCPNMLLFGVHFLFKGTHIHIYFSDREKNVFD